MKDKNNFRKVILIWSLIAVFIILLVIINSQIQSNVINEQQDLEKYSEWLGENCNCLKWGRIFCPGGFVLKNDTCRNEKEVTRTSRFIGCSEYNCSGEIKLFNNKTMKWEN